MINTSNAVCTYFNVLRSRKNPNNFKACNRVVSLPLANNLKTVLERDNQQLLTKEISSCTLILVDDRMQGPWS